MSDCFVLDSFAVLAYFRAEPGGERVRELIEAAAAGAALLMISLVNYGEVAYIIERKAGLAAAQAALVVLDQLPIDVVAPDRAVTLAAAQVKAGHPLAFADAFAVALAQTHGASILTGDPEFKSVDGPVHVEWLAT